MAQNYYLGITILVVALFGVVINVVSIVILALRKGATQMFHHLLKLLAFYDLVVVVGCAMLYALPHLKMELYARVIFPLILPWLLPIIQISMMSSVYCTIVMSFERYIRICHLCQLRDCSYITDNNFKYYIAAIIVVPVLFYIPKFFELKTQQVPEEIQIDCSALARLRKFNASVNTTHLMDNLDSFPSSCLGLDLNSSEDKPVYVRNITTYRYTVKRTALRANWLYYKIYLIGLNGFFASLLPMFSLLFLNVSTVLALHKMGRQQVAAQPHVVGSTLRGSNGNSSCKRSRRGKRCSLVKHRQTSPGMSSVSQEAPPASIPLESLEACKDTGKGLNGGEATPMLPFGSPRPNTSEIEIQEVCEEVVPVEAAPLNGPHQPENVVGNPRRPSSPLDEMRSKENRLTRISLCIVWLFIFCHIWKLIPTFYEGWHSDVKGAAQWPQWLNIINDISHTLIVFNSAVNFLIYAVL